MKHFHACSRNKITSIFSSVNSKDISAFSSCKTVQRRHWFCPKVNFLHDDGTQTAGCTMDDMNDALSAERMDENDNAIVIHAPEPKWNIALRDCE